MSLFRISQDSYNVSNKKSFSMLELKNLNYVSIIKLT